MYVPDVYQSWSAWIPTCDMHTADDIHLCKGDADYHNSGDKVEWTAYLNA